MPSALPRISTVMDPAAYAAIERLAKKDGVSLSQKTRDLILEALELVEDEWLDSLVQSRRKNKDRAVSHQQLKRKLGIK